MSKTRVRTPTSLLEMGHARVEITPPVGIYHRLWGAARHERATGVHRPLLADVLVLRPLRPTDSAAPADPLDVPGTASSGPLLVRTFLDLAGLVQSQHAQMVQALAEGAGVEPEQVMLTYSHTHSSGWFVPDRIPLPGGELILSYIEELRGQLHAAAREAARRLQPVTVSYATGRSAMGASRDYRDEDRGIYACGFNPDDTASDTVTVARFADASGRPAATLVHYACHPTSLAWENSLISPDYPGALRETVEQATGAPCIFAQGACGDIGPRRGFSGDVAVADRNGREVAYAALSALTSLGPPATDYTYAGPVVSGATLGVWHDVPHSVEPQRAADTSRFSGGPFTVDLPLKPRPDRDALAAELDRWEVEQRAADARGDAVAARDFGARAERARRWLARLVDLPPGETYPLSCAAYRLGDAVWAACGGEPYSAIQDALRTRFPHLTILFSPLLADLQVAYLLTSEKYGLGLYQEEPSILAQGCLERLTEAFAERIVQLTR